jgi:hypothetical protein
MVENTGRKLSLIHLDNPMDVWCVMPRSLGLTLAVFCEIKLI